MFDRFLYALREQDLGVGLQEWLAFLRGVREGLAPDSEALYHFGRSVLVHTESDYDSYDLAFQAAFGEGEGAYDAALVAELAKELDAWLEDPKGFGGGEAGDRRFQSIEELMDAFLKTLAEQRERHEGGNRWVGTGGTSPYGTGGRAAQGLQLGSSGGGRSGVRLADERRWRNYRTDMPLDVRDFKVALRALRDLAREGEQLLDLDETIDTTCKNAGEIDLVFRPSKKNRVRVTLLMDTGGSMDPYAALVSRLFTASKETKTFKTFEHYFFHNCVYRYLYKDFESYDRLPADEVLEKLTPGHRLIFVGDASMASWELMTSGAYGDRGPTGLERLKTFARKCEASVWLNPDPPRFWGHPTVAAIGQVFRMYPLTVDGLRESIRFLRAPR